MARFKELNVGPKEGLRFVWEWIGEGNEGEYDHDDPEDTPRLRATLYMGTEQVEDGSYCTLATPYVSRARLRRMAKTFLANQQVDQDQSGQWRLKWPKAMGRWTWTEY